MSDHFTPAAPVIPEAPIRNGTRPRPRKLSAYDALVLDLIKAALRDDVVAEQALAGRLMDAELKRLDAFLAERRARLHRDHGRRLQGGT